MFTLARKFVTNNSNIIWSLIIVNKLVIIILLNNAQHYTIVHLISFRNIVYVGQYLKMKYWIVPGNTFDIRFPGFNTYHPPNSREK